MRDCSTAELTGWNRPSASALVSRAASTSSTTSAGLAAPSACSRVTTPASSASMRLILMPVALVKLAYSASSVW